MTDKLTTAMPRIVKLLRMVLSPHASDGEWQNAFNLLMATLKEADPGGDEITRRIEAPSLSEEDMKKIFDTGIEIGLERGRVEAATRQRNVVAPTPPPMSIFGVPITGSTFSSLYGFDDSTRVSGHDNFNGYAWSDIANHCYANLHRIPDKHHGFLEDMADRLSGYGSVSGKQANYLGNLFRQFLSGRI